LPNKDYTYIAVIMDRSGSMSHLRQSTIDGFNEFLRGQQQLPGRADLMVIQFDHEYLRTHSGSIHSMPPLNWCTYEPRGATALYDAIGRAVNELGTTLAGMLERNRPGKVVVVIMTDGMENASTVFNAQQIGEMIKHQTEVYSWNFMFLGANQDAILSARALNISGQNSVTYGSNSLNLGATYTTLGHKMMAYRSTGLTSSLAFDEEDRRALIDPNEALKKLTNTGGTTTTTTTKTDKS